MNPRTHYLIHTNTKTLFVILSSIALLCAFFYVFFINSAIHKTALREDVRQKTLELQSQTSELEVEYFTVQKEITREYALRQGFVDVEETVFVSLPQTHLSFHE